MKLNKNKLKEWSNKDYKFFVCDTYDGLDIISGWEYKEDAKDSLNDELEICEDLFYNVELKVYTRKYLNNLIK